MTRRLAALSIAVTVVALTSTVSAADRWVSGEYSTIQAAIDDCNNGDVVIVEPNTYTGTGNKNLDFGGKAITVRSIDPDDPCVVAATVIDCEDSGRGFYFHSGEETNSVLSGFTIVRGIASKGGGVYCSGSSPRIEDCVITDNEVYGDTYSEGGGIYCGSNSHPRIIECTIKNNAALGPFGIDFGMAGGDGWGGGISCVGGSHPTIERCTIRDNLASGGTGWPDMFGLAENGNAYGGGMYCSSDSHPTIEGCIVADNTAWGGDGIPSAFTGGGYAFGGGIYGSLTMNSSVVRGNIALAGAGGDGLNGDTYGGGLYCGGASSINNSTVVNNTADSTLDDPWKAGQAVGGGVYGTDTDSIVNCVLWANTAFDGGPQVGGGCLVSYCDVEGGYSGEGNINADPMFADAGSDDYHLLLGSPCIDTGDPNYVGEPNETDLDGNPRVVCDVVDMGAYEFQGILYVDDDAPSDPPPGDPRGTEAHPFDDIQEAIDVARDGYTILVRPGQYLEPDPLDPQGLIFSGGNIRLTSIDPTDSNVVKNTVIRGFVQFDGTEDPNCTLRGFTIRNVAHGRIYGNHTHATISHCIISGNAPCWATVIENCHGTISNCVITDNFTIYLCGVEPVVLDCHGLIKNCTIANNASEIGVFAGGTTTLENCIIYYNGDQVELEPQIRVGSDATLNISYCDLQGHLIGISGEGSATIDIGPGIIDVDPCFVRPGSWDFNAVPDGLVEGDYHLKSAGWRWDPNETYWTYDDVTSRCIDAGNPGAPLGNELMKVLPDDPNNDFGVNLRINMGAYGGTAEASMALPGSVLLADLNNDGIVDTPDLGWQLADWLKSESEQPGDLNRDGFVDMLDYAMLAEAWMWSTDWADQPP